MSKKAIIGFILIGLSLTKNMHAQNNLKDKTMEVKTVTVVKSKAPWYAFDFLIIKGFRKVNPVYQKVDGLEFKAYSINHNESGKNFGGIYLWQNVQKAKSWYTPQWFEEVKKKRGVIPQVEYYDVISDISHLPENKNYEGMNTKSIAVFIHRLDKDTAKGLFLKQGFFFRGYLLNETDDKNGLILFFNSKAEAKSFIKLNKIAEFEWFKTPVMLNNKGQQL
ncbi:MAG TPA: hypothetical protein VFR70_04485 [Flavobacterium sp.]|nr:hypothetical protein [Flavobacterium sp.]